MGGTGMLTPSVSEWFEWGWANAVGGRAGERNSVPFLSSGNEEFQRD